jgi:hypothetical protein
VLGAAVTLAALFLPGMRRIEEEGLLFAPDAPLVAVEPG